MRELSTSLCLKIRKAFPLFLKIGDNFRQSKNKKIFFLILFVLIPLSGCVKSDHNEETVQINNQIKSKSPDQKEEWKITQYPSETNGQIMFYTIVAPDGRLAVIDGGYTYEYTYVRDILQALGGKVNSWILTHPHPDHMGAFIEIYRDPDGVEIDHIYTIDLDYDEYKQKAQPWDEFQIFETFSTLTKDTDNVTYLHEGDQLEIVGLQMKVYSAYDDYILERSNDLANDGSLMFKLSGHENTMLFCSDVGVRISDYLIERYSSELKADYIQMGHHGNGGLSDDFYKLVKPTKAFFDAPDWLMNNINPGTGEPATYDTPEKKQLMEELGAKIYSFETAPNTVIIR